MENFTLQSPYFHVISSIAFFHFIQNVSVSHTFKSIKNAYHRNSFYFFINGAS